MEAARILLVDDEETNLDLCARRLQRNGFVVDCVGSGQAALESLRHSEYDLMLLDQMMPLLSGEDVLRELRIHGIARGMPIIMVTAVTESARIAEALNKGADDYITKPIDFPVAVARIRSQLARRGALKELQRREEQYSLAFRSAAEALWEWNFISGQVFYSTQWKHMLGFDEEEIGTAPAEWLSRVHPRDLTLLQEKLDLHLRGDSAVFECQHRLRDKSGEYRCVLSKGLATRNPEGAPMRMAGSQSDITDRYVQDPVTGLRNRTCFMERLAAALERTCSDFDDPGACAPSVVTSVAILLLDVDHFKFVNETLGHGEGDRLLTSVALRLEEQLGARTAKNGMMLARLGGDEFAVLLEAPACEIQRSAAKTAEILLGATRDPFTLEGREFYISISIGIAIASGADQTAEHMVRDADVALYAAKAQGKARFALFEPAMSRDPRHFLEIASDLRRAIDRQEFEVYYQPRMRLADGTLRGFEALVRWNHPTRGLLSPDAFIPIAEETGLIVELGHFVLHQACKQMQQWREDFPQSPWLDVAVNLSVGQCREPGLVSRVIRVLEETQLPASCLHLELTESLLMGDLHQVRGMLHQLKSLGVGLKIDDFGMGYSCLRYVGELPFDTLKIDRCFTMAMDQGGSSSGEMVKIILAMAKSLGLGVIAEGVERLEHVSALRALGCEFAQGYYFSRPISAADTLKLLSQHVEGADNEPEGSLDDNGERMSCEEASSAIGS